MKMWLDIASVLIPVLVVVVGVYIDRGRLQTQAMIGDSQTRLINLINENKTELMAEIGSINTKIEKNSTADEYRDRELKRLSYELNRLSHK